MPELPEVHTTATTLHKLVAGKTIIDIWSNYRSIFHAGKNNIKDAVYLEKFIRKITGAKIVRVRRRAKNVLFDLSKNITVLIHMKMTGHLLYGRYVKNKNQNNKSWGWNSETWLPNAPNDDPLWDPFNRFIRLVFSFRDGTNLVLSDMRRFAKVTYFDTNSPPEEITKLGPEPLEKEFTFIEFKSCLERKPNGKIKQVLMNQEIISGIGNIYSDEMLWSSSIHPLSTVSTIPEKSLKKLYAAMKEVLEKGIDFRGDSTSDYRMPSGKRGEFQYHHKAYQNTGERCLKIGCEGTIDRIKVGGRSAHFCNTHQQKF